MHDKIFSPFLAVFVAVAVPAMRGQGNLIVNGSFEEPLITDLTRGISVSTDTLPGWTAYPNGTFFCVQTHSGIYWPWPVDGIQQMTFNGGSTPPGGYLEQTIKTPVGANCELSFYVGHGGWGGGDMAVRADLLDASGGIIASITGHALQNGNDFNTSPTVLYFVAASPSTRLRLTDVSTGAFASDCMLDMVTVDVIGTSGVPEPTTAIAGALLLVPLVFGSFRGVRKTRVG